MFKQIKLISLLSILAIVIVACGGNDADGGASGDAQQAEEEATTTPFPTFEFVAPTNPPVFNQSAEETEEADSAEMDEETETIELDERAVSRGLGRYEALACAECHGEAGVGVDGENALIGYSATEDEFITFMRTGGDIGNDHQFSTDRLSQNGATNLYQYLLSLSQGE